MPSTVSTGSVTRLTTASTGLAAAFPAAWRNTSVWLVASRCWMAGSSAIRIRSSSRPGDHEGPEARAEGEVAEEAVGGNPIVHLEVGAREHVRAAGARAR